MARSTPSAKLITHMKDYVSGGLPVRLALEADSGFEISIRRLATFPDHLRQGYATEVMTELCRMADRLDVTIGLEALPEEQDEPEDELDLDALVAFYAKFGFTGEATFGDESAWMSREPNARPSLQRQAPNH
jgi:hypothetical protein